MSRRSLLACGMWLCLVVYMLIGSLDSRFAPSFHDLAGGRLPMADGAAWFVGSTQASRGYHLGWVGRRPLNVVFNAPLIRLSDRLAADPLVMTLQLKRSLAFAAIASLVIALEGCCSIVARLGIGLSLLSSLFVSKLSEISYLIGTGVGYTQGSELNAFICVVAAAACLVAASRCLGKQGQRRRLVLLGSGLFLLCAGCSIRPGTLLLMPLLMALFGAVEAHALGLPWRPLSLRLWSDLRPWFLTVGLAIGSCLLMQQLAFAQVNDGCGAIGGNQGLTLYGLSRGLDWNAGVAYQKEHNISCEKDANRILKKQALSLLMRNPAPAIAVITDNLDKNNHVAFTAAARPGRRSWPLLLLATLASAFLLWRARIPGPGGFLRGDNLVLLIGLLGWLSMEIFVIILFRDAYLRPLAPYAVFPILALWFVLDRLMMLPPGLVRPASASLLLLPSVLVGQMLMGSLILLAGKPFPPSHFPAQVNGQFSMDIAQLRSTGAHTWMFELGLPFNYKLVHPLPPSLRLHADPPSGTYCITYQRRRLLDSFDPYGRVSIDPGDCRR